MIFKFSLRDAALFLFLVYLATSFETFFAIVDGYFINPSSVSDTPDGAAPFDQIIEALVFAAVYLTLVWTTRIRRLSLFGVATAVVASDLVYMYVYRPILDSLQISSLQEHFLLRIAVFCILFSIVLIIADRLHPFSRILNSISARFPLDKSVENVLVAFAAVFLSGIVFSLAGLFFFEVLNVAGYLYAEPFGLASMLHMAQALPYMFTPFVLALILFHSSGKSDVLLNLNYLAGAASSGYLALYTSLLPISVMGSQMQPGRAQAIFVIVLLFGAFSLGIKAYQHKDNQGIKILFRAAIFLVLLAIGAVVVVVFPFLDPFLYRLFTSGIV